MSHLRSLLSFFAAAALAVLTIVAPVRAQTLFEGARLITGDGGVIEDSAFVVTGNQISQVGRKGGDGQDHNACPYRRARAYGLSQGARLLAEQLHARESLRHSRPLRLLRRGRHPRSGHGAQRSSL